MKTISVYGLGYIGLPTAAVLASRGYQVSGIDVSPSVVDTVNKGEVHIVEPELQELVSQGISSGNLVASLSAKVSDIHLITVPTPFNENKEPDLSYVLSVVNTICTVLKEDNLIVLESTSPVGTTELLQNTIRSKMGASFKVHISYSPERVIPGSILKELVANDRVVGGLDDDATKKAATFYRTFVNGEVHTTDSRTAEMCKLTENAYRDVNIAYANEISMICDDLNINPWELISLANKHPRVDILSPGPGVGGHCIAVDPWFIVSSNPSNSTLIKAAREVNDSKPHWIIEKVMKEADSFFRPVIACLGAAFKANIDDLRESPSIKIIQKLQELDIGEILTVEPNIDSADGLCLVSLEHAINVADIIVVLVEHREFTKIDRALLSNKIIIDAKGIL